MPPVHDYVIDNSTGANVRADINNVLQAILTNNSSSSAPSTTAAYMWWADTTNGVLKIRNSSNNDWVELLQLDGTLTLEDGSASTPGLAFRDDLNTGIFSSASDTFNIATGGVERVEFGTATIFNDTGADVDLRIEGDTDQNLLFCNAGGNAVGIGTSTPGSKLHIFQSSASAATGNSGAGLSLESNNHQYIQYLGANTKEQGILFGDDADNDVGSIVYNHSDNKLTFATAANMRLMIDSSGRVLLGTSTARSPQGISAALQVEGTDANSSSFSLTRNSANQHSANLIFNKSRGSSVGSDTVVQDDDALGLISWVANDGTDSDSVAARISALIDGTPGSNDTPGRLVLSTTADGASTPTERMRIDSSGNTHFGSGGSLNSSNTVSIIPADGRITFGMDGRDSLVTGESGAYIFSGSGASGSILAGELVIQTRSDVNRDLHFATGGTPTMRGRFRGSDGDFFLGNDLGSITNLGTRFSENDAGGNTNIQIGHGTTGAAYSYIIFRFGSSGTTIGNIAQNSAGNAVTYNTTSDYRLKTNEVLITDGITRIKQLKPYKFEWKSDLGTKVDGFFAHEVSSIVPNAVSGEKDAVETIYYDDEKHLPEGKSIGDVKETDKPVYQSIDHSKLVPLLVAAVQELTARVETLEAA